MLKSNKKVHSLGLEDRTAGFDQSRQFATIPRKNSGICFKIINSKNDTK